MIISGRKLQEKLIPTLQKKIEEIKKEGITPTIAIVTLGDEATWEAYVSQKVKLAKKLGIEARLINLRPRNTEEIIEVIEKLNDDNLINGLIVQRPFPIHIDTKRIIQSVSKEKDIDGFRDDSLYDVPMWLAVERLINEASGLRNNSEIKKWLLQRSVLVVGKGETAGQPSINGLKKLGINPFVIDSKSVNRESLFRNADIVISATGKSETVPVKILKKNCILIGIGLHREDGILIGDFNEIEAENAKLTYSPSPGGVGPLNLYYLFDNLVKAANLSVKTRS